MEFGPLHQLDLALQPADDPFLAKKVRLYRNSNVGPGHFGSKESLSHFTQVRRGHHLGKLEIQLTMTPITQEEYDQV